MTPAARAQAAIQTLDRIAAGTPAEQALTNWARGARYAGSGDRAAVRDLVYQALRRLRSCAVLGGLGDLAAVAQPASGPGPLPVGMPSGSTVGRRLILGLLRGDGRDPGLVFTGAPHAPAPLLPAESAGLPDPSDLPQAVGLDCPEALVPALRRALDRDLAPVLASMRDRAPVFLRVNLARVSRAEAITRLAGEGIEAEVHPLAEGAVVVRAGESRIRTATAFAEGLVEVQDAASQALVEELEIPIGGRILDYCAGGGGKTLAMAARAIAAAGAGAKLPDLTAHDISPRRMRDLPARAARAGIRVRLAETSALIGQGYDLVLADAPCSGSGTWRRQPEAKWRLTPQALAEQARVQASVIDAAARLVRPGGVLAYATCSLLCEENEDIADAFAARSGWQPMKMRRIGPTAGTDAFFLATFRAPSQHR